MTYQIFAHDYETTGVDPKTCGVVQACLCIADLHEDGSYTIRHVKSKFLNPGCEIPEQASNVHGIYFDMVKDEENWDDWLRKAVDKVNSRNVDLVVGYNSNNYDNVIAGRVGLNIINTLDVFKATKRIRSAGLIDNAKLGTAYEALTGGSAEGAHDALKDIYMTLDLIKPCMSFAGVDTVTEFLTWLNSPKPSLSSVMPFGKHKGKKISEVPSDYCRWAVENMTSIDDDLKMSLLMRI